MMRVIRFAVITAAIALLAIISSSSSGSAQSVVPLFGAPSVTKVCGVYDNDEINVSELPEGVVVTLDSGWMPSGSRIVMVAADSGYSLSPGQTTRFEYYDNFDPCPVTASAPIQTTVCGYNNDLLSGVPQEGLLLYSGPIFWVNNQFNYTYQAEFGFYFTGPSTFLMTDSGPCETEQPIPPAVNLVCGVDNDDIVIPHQPVGVGVVSDPLWVNGQKTIRFVAASDYYLPAGIQTEYTFTDSGPCITDDPAPPTVTTVCGVDNDDVFIPDQPANVLVNSAGVWTDGSWNVSFSAAEHYVLPAGIQTEYTFVDDGPCVTEAPVAPMVTAVCGADNDEVIIPDQPENVLVTGDDAWLNGSWNVLFSAAENYVLPDGIQTEYTFVDDGPCTTEAPVAPLVTEVCGADNDVVQIPTQPANVLVTADDAWLDGSWNVTFNAAVNYVLPADTQTEYTFTDADIPCPTDAPIPPVQVAVCGADNDDLIFAENQPEGVELISDSNWIEGERTVIYSFVDSNSQPQEETFSFTDDGAPCEVGAAVPPVQVDVCGADNDIVNLASNQPEGVTLESDSDWMNGERTITYAIPAGYVTSGATQFTLVDANTPCPTEEPATFTVVVQLVMPNDASAAGAGWQLFTPAAAQTGIGLVAEGVVDTNNQIHPPALLPGSYRLLVSVDGYEPVDTTLEISAGTTIIEIAVNALQPAPATPTPVPAEPAPAPTATVSSLPETGSGPIGSPNLAGFAIVIVAGLLVAIIRRERSNAC